MQRIIFDGQPNGTTISTSNTGFGFVSIGTGTTLTFDTSVYSNGAESMKLTSASGVTVFGAVTTLNATQLAVNGYIYFDTLPSLLVRLCDIRTNSGTVLRLQLTTGNKLEIQEGGGSTQAFDEGVALSAATWYRFEITITTISATAGTYTLNYYALGSTSPVETGISKTAGNLGTANITTIHWGSGASTTWTGTAHFANLAYNAGSTAEIGILPTVTSPSQFVGSGVFPAAAVNTSLNGTPTPAQFVGAYVFPNTSVAIPGDTTAVPMQYVGASTFGTFPAFSLSSTVFPDPQIASYFLGVPSQINSTPITIPEPVKLIAAAVLPMPVIVFTLTINASVTAATLTGHGVFPASSLSTGLPGTAQPVVLLATAVIPIPKATSGSTAVAPGTYTAICVFNPATIAPPTLIFLFTPPTVFDVPSVDLTDNPMNGLMKFYQPGERGQSVWLTSDGVYTLQQPALWDEQPGSNTPWVQSVFYGGHQYQVSAQVAQALQAAGFTVQSVMV
ncbi:MAG: hypothetical protein WB777_14285 [Mycobacterium sp.]